MGGVVLNSSNVDKECLVEEIIFGIEKIKEEGMNSLIIEDLHLLNRVNMELIESRTKLKVLNGVKVLVYFLPLVLNNIYKILNEDLKEKEVLVIGDDEELTKEVIESLHKEIRFITLVGDYENSIENISRYILEKTGLSVFYSKDIHKILKNYSIIINLKSKICIDVNQLRRKAVVFDFSIEKALNKSTNRKKEVLIIEDFIFKSNNLNIKQNEWIEYLIPSYTYEYFHPLQFIKPEGLVVNGELCSIKAFIDSQLGNRTVST